MATRYDKRAYIYLGTVTVAAIAIWLRSLRSNDRPDTAYADPAARQAATDLLPHPVLTHAALLSALTRLDPGAAADQLAFTGRLANADPGAAADLAAFLTRAAGGTS